MPKRYSALISDFNGDIAKLGITRAQERWRSILKRLAPDKIFSEGHWSGDFFDKANPLWTRLGIVKPGVSGKPTVSNNRAARLQAMRALRAAVTNDSGSQDIRSFLP